MGMILGVDFDGTIVESRFPAIGPEAPGAFFWLKRFQELGARLILLTMRSDPRLDGPTPLADAIAFCRQNGVVFWAHNTNPDQVSWTLSTKVFAHGYIDDAAIGCPLISHPVGGKLVVDWSVVGPLAEARILAHRKIVKP
jgi:hypothetical protein